MPRTTLRPSNRAKAAIAAVLATATLTGGYIMLPTGEKVPPSVVLAMDHLVTPWEGTELRAYLDGIARPPVWTICAGDTQNVKPGMIETPAGCDKRLRTRLINDYYRPLRRCIADFDSKPVSWGAMMISLSWNVGTGAACASTAARLGRAGKYRESCDAATAFNKAGGKVINGLVNRREMGDRTRIGEGELCVTGLEMKAAPPPVPLPPAREAAAPAAVMKPPASGAAVAIPIVLLIGSVVGFLIYRRRRG